MVIPDPDDISHDMLSLAERREMADSYNVHRSWLRKNAYDSFSDGSKFILRIRNILIQWKP